MKELGTKIRDIRKSKAYSQEVLAEKSTLNVRTIQRIESGENTPHGKTLELLCEALEITPNEILSFNLREDNTTLMWLYFSVGATMVLPLGGILVPLILWISNKKTVENIDHVGRNIVYNQIIISVVAFILLVFFVYQKINEERFDFQWGFLTYLLLNGLNVLFAFYAGIKAYKGKIVLYPFFR